MSTVGNLNGRQSTKPSLLKIIQSWTLECKVAHYDTPWFTAK